MATTSEEVEDVVQDQAEGASTSDKKTKKGRGRVFKMTGFKHVALHANLHAKLHQA